MEFNYLDETTQKIHDRLRDFGSHFKSIRLLPYDGIMRSSEHNMSHRKCCCTCEADERKCLVHLMLRYSCKTVKALDLYWFDFNDTQNLEELRPLFSDLQTLSLTNCLISIKLLAMCQQITELTLIRTDVTNTDAQNLQLDHLKTLKIEKKKHHDADFPIFEFINQCDSLEYFEMDSLRYQLPKSFYDAVPKFKNITTLKVYSIFNGTADYSFDIINELPKLSELVWGYPARFTLSDLMCMIQKGSNLQQLVVICYHAITAVSADELHINEESYRNMLETVSRRPNKKPLNIIIFGTELQIKKFRITFPMQPRLKITSLGSKSVAAILNIKLDGGLREIKMSDEVIEILRNRQLLH